MHLIKALAAGVVGAENGTATLYRHGTGTVVGYYTLFEDGSISAPGAIGLDEYGSAVVYTDELVRVVVEDANGSTVRAFTEGNGDNNTEVRSTSFTGTDYNTLVSAAGNPTTLRSVLDRWLTSAGALDWNVDVLGVSTSLQSAATGAYGVFYNVKASAYGATGNGTTDDRTAILAAITAASNAGGGIVFFPAGAYKVSSAMSVPATVSLLGAGSDASFILSSHASADLLDFAGSPTANRFVEGLALGASVSNSGQILDISNTEKLVVRNCRIGINNTGRLMDVATGGTPYFRLEGCTVSTAGTALEMLLVNGAARAGRVEIVGCTFVSSAGYNIGAGSGALDGSNMFIRDCVFDATATTSGTFSWIVSGATLYGSVHGCEFLEPASGTATITCMNLGTLSSSSEWFVEDGNIIPNNTTHYTLYAYTHSADGYYVKLGTRETRYLEIAVTAAGPTSLGDIAQYGVISVRSTYAGVMTYTASACGPMGCKTNILIVNGDASTRVITLGTNFKSAGTYSLLTNEAMGIEVVAMSPPAGAAWYLTAFSGSDAASDGYTV